VRHRALVRIEDEHGNAVDHTPSTLTRIYDEELEKILSGQPCADTRALYRLARQQSESMIVNGEHDPV
jgi:hypothetical protein